MNSVVTDNNMHPPAPRLYAHRDVELLASRTLWCESIAEFYTNQFATETVVKLTDKVRRKVSYDGQVPGVTGRKDTIFRRLKDADTHFITTVLRPLTRADQYWVETEAHRQLARVEAGLEVVQSIGQLPVTRNVLRQLRPNCPEQSDFMEVVVALFRQRDERICSSHADVNGGNQAYSAISHSLFYCPAVLENLDDDVIVDATLIQEPTLTNPHHPTTIEDVHTMYLL
ncbi:hypothetical protein B484DRAFT_473426, partial [Ochromonadaceae sp. CCMP2298]